MGNAAAATTTPAKTPQMSKEAVLAKRPFSLLRMRVTATGYVSLIRWRSTRIPRDSIIVGLNARPQTLQGLRIPRSGAYKRRWYGCLVPTEQPLPVVSRVLSRHAGEANYQRCLRTTRKIHFRHFAQ